jgi:Icc-related predicted phosphoesterase
MSESTEERGTITVAAIGDLHVTETSEHRYREMFAEIAQVADVLALAGDLTNFGKSREAEILAEDLFHCTIPTVAVLGNHDYECGQPEEVARILRGAGVTILDDQAIVIQGVGFAGVKGFLGGYGRGELGSFGEAPIKQFVDAGYTHVYVHQLGPDQDGFFSFYENEVLPELR